MKRLFRLWRFWSLFDCITTEVNKQQPISVSLSGKSAAFLPEHLIYLFALRRSIGFFRLLKMKIPGNDRTVDLAKAVEKLRKETVYDKKLQEELAIAASTFKEAQKRNVIEVSEQGNLKKTVLIDDFTLLKAVHIYFAERQYAWLYIGLPLLSALFSFGLVVILFLIKLLFGLDFFDIFFG